MPVPITDPIDELDDIDIAMPTLAAAVAPAQTPDVLDAAPIISPPATDEERVAQAALAMVAQAKAFAVTDAASFERAGQLIDALKQRKKDVEGWFKPMADAAHKAWTTITGRRGAITAPLDEAITVLASRYSAFAREERERAEAERRRQEQEAQARERARLQAEADERARAAEEATQAALLASSQEEAQAFEQQAEQLTAEAAVIKQEAATVEAPVLPVHSTIDHVKGPAVAQNWQHEVMDLDALIQAVAAGQVSRQAVLANDTYLRQRAKADKGTMKIPGVRFFDAGSVRASRGRR